MNKNNKSLTYFWVLSIIRNIVSSLWDYLSLALAFSILLSLFIYVFKDLLTRQLANLPQLASISIGFGALFGSVFQTRMLLAISEENDLLKFGEYIIAPNKELRTLKTIRFLVWIFFAPITAWYFIGLLPSWHLGLVAGLFVANLLVFIAYQKLKPSKSLTTLKPMTFLNSFPTMLKWRLVRLLIYNQTSRNMLLVACLLNFVMIAMPSSSVGFLWLIACSAGQLAGTAHAIIASEDLRSSWLEKNAGLSHSDFMTTHLQLAGIIALALLAPGLVFLGLSNIVLSQKVSLIMTAPCISGLIPGIILQIDGKRPEVTSIVLFLLGLFIATAILAHPLSICLTFLVISYGLSSQTDRYYRQ